MATITVTVTDALGSTATGTTTVTASSGTTVNVGQTTQGPTADSGNGNLLLAQPIVLSQQGTIQSLSFLIRTVSGQLRLGLYSGTTGPSTLVAQTAAFTPVAGWNTQPVVTPVACPAGNYWLAYLPASNTLGFWVQNSGGTAFYKPQTFGALPATFPSGSTSVQSLWSFYATFQVTPDTQAPTVPINATWTENPGVSINLSWTASTDNVGVKGYNVFRNGAQIATPTTNSYADTGPLTAGTGYTYTVSAFDAAGNTSMPASFASTVFPTKNIAPPAGDPPQHPTILNGYAARPPWQVAGVDFYVGCPSSVVLRNANTISMAGVTVDNTNAIITVTGNNVVLDSYDFTGNGGWMVELTTGSNLTISNSKMMCGSKGNACVFGNVPTAVGITIFNCTIDGGSTVNPPQNGGVITQFQAGLILHNNWIKNAGQDMIQCQGGGNLTWTNNLFEGCGLLALGHEDYLQSINGPFVANFTFNTLYQNTGQSQGIMLEPDGGSPPIGVITSAVYANNTLICTANGSMNFLIGITQADIVTTLQVVDNYYDQTGAIGFVRNAVGSSAYPNDGFVNTVFGTAGHQNIDMSTGVAGSDGNDVPPGHP